MSPEHVVHIGKQALELTLLLLLVLLIPGLLVGLIVSMFQAATQINEVTLSFIPKMLVTLGIMVIAGPWMLRTLVEYTRQLIQDIPNLIG